MTVSTTSLSNQLSRDLVRTPNGSSSIDVGREGLPDFQTLMLDSNQAHQVEQEKKKATMGDGGELRLGETTDDKAFREMLEKVTGQPQRKNKNSLEKEDFLNLMVTQLKYQDPTKPADHQDMAAQLAQFNTVEQLSQANRSLDSMSRGQEELKADKMTEYLGREVTATGSKLRTNDESKMLAGTSGGFVLPMDAGSVTVTIKNDKNEVIRTLALGPQTAGEHPITWDGTDSKGEKVGAGIFTFDLVAQTTDGKKIDATSQVTAEVTGVSQLGKGGRLETALGEVTAKDIVAVRKPGTEPAVKEETQSKDGNTKLAAKQYNETAAPKQPPITQSQI
jgi:flagellar basal-body rod modification protein FlgD